MNSPGFNPPPDNQIMGRRGPIGHGCFVDDRGITSLQGFADLLRRAVVGATCEFNGEHLNVAAAVARLRIMCLTAHSAGHKCIIIGNGGSAGIASHVAVDWTKNGGIRTIAFNDAPTLTCLSNDFGYAEVFAKQLEYYAHKGDCVIIISSSGKSENILRAAEQAFEQGLDLVTLSGQNPDNTLRLKGILNMFVPATDYGIVEIAHLTLLHAVVSIRSAS